MNLNLLTKLFLMAILGLGLALYGCPPTTPGDDDDDDDAGDDDAGDDDAGDDDMGDDDAGDDDARVVVAGTYVEQSLAGATSTTATMADADYTFDITYTTVSSTGTSQYAFPDGVYTFAYDSDYQYGGYDAPSIFWYYGSWYWYYIAYPGQGGHTLEYAYPSWGQYGYWDVTGGTAMTGMAINTQ